MISENTRKQILLSSLVFVLSIILSTFIGAFIPLRLIFAQLLPVLLIYTSITWLGYSFILYYKDEKDKILNLIGYFFMIGGITSFIMIGLAYFDYNNHIFNNTIEIILQAFNASLNILFIIAFYLISIKSKEFVRKKRNIIKLGIGPTFGYLMLLAYSIINIVVPPTAYVDPSGENPMTFLIISAPKIYLLKGVLISSYKALYFVLNILEITYLFAVVVGVWKLRKIIAILDQIPKELFLQMEQQMASIQNKANTSSAIMFDQGNTQGSDGVNSPFSTIFSDQFMNNAPETNEKEQQQAAINATANKRKKMFCIECGAELDPDSLYCKECGAKNPYIIDNSESDT